MNEAQMILGGGKEAQLKTMGPKDSPIKPAQKREWWPKRIQPRIKGPNPNYRNIYEKSIYLKTHSTRKYKEILIEATKVEILSIKAKIQPYFDQNEDPFDQETRRNPDRSSRGQSFVDQGWKISLIRPEFRLIRLEIKRKSWSNQSCSK